jgi:hypothetical protein
MTSLSPRIEVGVLKFQKVLSLEGAEGLVAPSFRSIQSVESLVVEEPGIEFESAICIKSIDGKELIVVADAMPCTITVRGLDAPLIPFQPEYNISKYRRELL